MEKLIITAAISGAEVTKNQNPNIPYTIDEIGFEAKVAHDAGASIIHLHVRDDKGNPTQNKDRFKDCIDEIRKRCPEVIIQPSTGGSIDMDLQERIQPLFLNPEMATLDCGTCNFGGDEIFINTENMIKKFAKEMNSRGIKAELEVFDKGMIDMALSLEKEGYIKTPLHFNFVLGVKGGINATARDLIYLANSIPTEASYTVTGIGRHQFLMAAISIAMGGHVRVGFEDNIYLSKGVLAQSNGELVQKVARIARELGRDLASPSDTRKILRI